MKGLAFLFLTVCLGPSLASAARHPELVEPGKTRIERLSDLLGKPMRVVREGPTSEYYFYRLGNGSTMDATVHARGGVVSYVTYLCSESVGDMNSKYVAAKRTEKVIRTTANAYVGALSQVMYPELGRGFLYEPKTKKVKACLAWEPGTELEKF